MAVVEASKKALWLRRLVETFDIIQNSVEDHCNSQSAIDLAKDHKVHKQMKHIDVKYHKIRQWVVNEKVIDLTKNNTKKNTVDMMTKIIWW